MAPSVRKALGNAALTLVVAALAVGSVAAWKRYGRANPYAGLDKKRASDPNAVIQGKDIEIRHYQDGKQVASAHANSMTIGQDRGLIKVKGIKNGVMNSPEGAMQFAAGEGILRPNMKLIDVSHGVRVKGKDGTDFDITSQQASIDGRIGQITVPTPLKGTIMGGQLTADRMVRRMNTDYAEILRPAWKGKIKAQNAPAEVKDKTWTFTGDKLVHNGRLNVATNAWASDGEMVVTAPHGEENTKTKVMTATGEGNVRATYHSAKADIIADKVVVYRDEKKVVCTGHVLVYVRPKKDWDKPLQINDEDRGPIVPEIPMSLTAKLGQGSELSPNEKKEVEDLRSSKNLRDYPMQMAAEEVTYWYKEGERRAIVKGGNPTAFQKFDDGRWRQTWAPEAHYDGEKDMLDLIGSDSKREVHLKNSIEDVTDCFNAKLSTKEDQTEDDEYLEMKSPKGRVIDFDDDKPKANSGGAKPAGSKPGGGPVSPPSGGPAKPKS